MLKFIANLLGYDIVKQKRSSLELGGIIPPPKPKRQTSCHPKGCGCEKCTPYIHKNRTTFN